MVTGMQRSYITCSVWFGGLDVQVSRLSQEVIHALLHVRVETSSIFPSKAYKPWNISPKHYTEHPSQTLSGHENEIQMQPFHRSKSKLKIEGYIKHFYVSTFSRKQI